MNNQIWKTDIPDKEQVQEHTIWVGKISNYQT